MYYITTPLYQVILLAFLFDRGRTQSGGWDNPYFANFVGENGIDVVKTRNPPNKMVSVRPLPIMVDLHQPMIKTNIRQKLYTNYVCRIMPFKPYRNEVASTNRTSLLRNI